jgi:hypothetical protein
MTRVRHILRINLNDVQRMLYGNRSRQSRPEQIKSNHIRSEHSLNTTHTGTTPLGGSGSNRAEVRLLHHTMILQHAASDRLTDASLLVSSPSVRLFSDILTQPRNYYRWH